MNLLLVGAGGHARVVADLVRLTEHTIAGYVDAQDQSWLSDVQCLARSDDELLKAGKPQGIDTFAIGLGGISPAQLAARLGIFDRYASIFVQAPAFVHPSAIVASGAEIGAGSVVMAGAIINPGARIGRGVIVNTGAVVEHDAVIGEGSHIAPRAVVLGGVRVGGCAMIGAGAIVLPNASVNKHGLVRSLTRFPA